MQRQRIHERRRSLVWTILKFSRQRHKAGDLSVESLLEDLGGKSFAWAILVFALFAMLPFPPGATLLTALPLLLVTAQMTLGYPHLKLPNLLLKRKIDHGKLRKTIIWLRPATKHLDRLLRPRNQTIFNARYERIIGGALLAISFALFLPIPFSGWLCAFSLFVYAAGAAERDGLIALFGLMLGTACLVFTTAVVSSMAVTFDIFT